MTPVGDFLQLGSVFLCFYIVMSSNGIWTVKSLCHLSPDFCIRITKEEKQRRNRLTELHVEKGLSLCICLSVYVDSCE